MAEPVPPVKGAGSDPGVPYRTIITVIAFALVTYIGVHLVMDLRRILTWLVVAGFFAVVLNPAVDVLVHRLRLRRTLAALVVFVLGVATVTGLLYLFIRPIVDQASNFSDNFSTYVNDAKSGKGEIGKLVKRYKIDQWVQDNQGKLKSAVSNSGKQALGLARKVGNTVAAVLTILVLTYLLLVEGPRVLAGGVGMLSPPWQKRLNRIGRDAARAMTGYMAGNLLISVIAGVVTYTGLWIFGVPFRTVLAVWVGFADLIPLVGATLGAIPTVFVALLHSPTAAIGMIIIYVVYQQFENHVIQVAIMSRTVRLSPLGVLVSVLAGVELYGLIGALLAIPLAGVIQVVAKDVYRERQEMKAERARAEQAAAAAAAASAQAAEGSAAAQVETLAALEQTAATVADAASAAALAAGAAADVAELVADPTSGEHPAVNGHAADAAPQAPAPPATEAPATDVLGS